MKELSTNHGKVSLPAFFPTIGWPGGKGEYDFLFKNMKEFCDTINHKHFLFNFASFAVEWKLKKGTTFSSDYTRFKNKDIRGILKEGTEIDEGLAEELVILLDVGGNRIFNKVLLNEKDPLKYESYSDYLDAHRSFVAEGNPDIYVAFEIGPSYTTRDEISQEGVRIWNSSSDSQKRKLNKRLLETSIKSKPGTAFTMVSIGAKNVDSFLSRLAEIHEIACDDVNIIGIGGIANQGSQTVAAALKTFCGFCEDKDWAVQSHGLGLGGWSNIPILVKYGVASCDVATPWRRACTDVVSSPYVPFLDEELQFTGRPDAFSYKELYDPMYNEMECECPFCNRIPLTEVRKRSMKADKHISGKDQHDSDFREMRIRIFFHNVFQHIALLEKLSQYKEDYGPRFLMRFAKDIPDTRMARLFSRLDI